MKGIRKIDIHAHAVWDRAKTPLKKWVDGDQLVEIYDSLGIERGLLLPIIYLDGMVDPISNEDVAELCRAHPDRFSRFCCVDPEDSKALKKLERYKLEGAVGLGELTTSKYFDSPEIDRLLSAAEELSLPVLFHISPAIGGGYGVVDDEGLPRLEKMLKKHRDLIFVGHSQPFWYEISSENEGGRRGYPAGKVKEGRLASLLREYGNLCCDLSAKSGSWAMMRDREYASRFLAEFSDRVMLGCDICLPGVTYPFEFSDFLSDMVATGELSVESYERICAKNAEKIFDI